MARATAAPRVEVLPAQACRQCGRKVPAVSAAALLQSVADVAEGVFTAYVARDRARLLRDQCNGLCRRCSRKRL